MTDRKQVLQNIISERPEDAVLVANKYKVLAGMIRRMYPQLREIEYLNPVIVNISSGGQVLEDRLADIIYHAVNGDRDWRKLTEGEDKENKERLEQKYLEENHEYPITRQESNLLKNL